MADWPWSSENEAQQGWEEENSFTQIPILIWQTTASQTLRLFPRWGHNWWRRYTLWIFFFFFFYGFHSFCHGKSFSLLCVYKFPLLIWGLAWKGIYSCLWGWASLRTIFLGKVTCWYPTNKIVLQAKMCSSHPQGQRHWS